MVAALSRIRQSTFIRHNTIYFVGAVLTGFFNYLYYPVLGRLMDPSSFGEVQTLVSLFLQVITFLTVMGLLSVTIVANYDDQRLANRIVMELEKLALIASVGLLVITALAGPWLKEYFRFGSALPFTMLGLAIVVTVPFTFRSAYLRGRRLFGLFSIANAGSSAFKVLASGVLVALGLGTSGALLGVTASQVVAFLCAAYYARKHGFGERLRHHIRMPDIRLVLPELKYSLLVLVVSLAVTVLYSVDIVVVKHYFDAHTAGLYASVATVSRILFFLTASMAQVMIPSVKLQEGIHGNLSILIKSIGLTVGVGGVALIAFWLAPELVIRILMGEKYLEYAGLLPRLSLAIFVVSILNLLLSYYMALRRYAIGIIALIGVVGTYSLMVVSHQTLAAIVNGLLYGSLATTGGLLVWMLWAHYQHKERVEER